MDTILIKLHCINGKDYHILDNKTGKRIGFILKDANPRGGYELFPEFKDVPEEFPKRSSSHYTAWAAFHKYYKGR
jgi:hypothetical protein